MTDIERWAKVASEPSPWDERLRLMAGLVPENSSVLDVGAGSMDLRRYLPNGCRYQPLDCVPGDGVIVHDFNAPQPYDNGSRPPAQWDVAVCSGVLEYVTSPAAFFRAVEMWARRVVLSYAVTDLTPVDHAENKRRASGWLNDLSHRDVLDLARVAGLRGGRVATWSDQHVYLFEREEAQDPVRAYWVTCGWRNGNAGDEATRDIAASLSGMPVVQVATPGEANLVACGSIAQDIPSSYAGAVWGTGLMFEHSRVYTPRARVMAVRGKLTARRWEGLGDVVLGDPGLLVAEVYGVTRQEKPRYRVGLVPHYVDGDNEGVRAWACAFRDEVTVIDICARPADVLRAMADCGYILSSSLHGLVFADSLGLPNDWVYLSDKLAGGSFKFKDYVSVFGIDDPLPVPFGAATTPSDIVSRADRYERPGIEAVKAGLRESFPWKRAG